MKKIDQSEIIVDMKKIFNPIAITVLVVLLFVNILLFVKGLITIPQVCAGFVVTVLIASSIKMADQWEKAVVLRVGKYKGLKGPGLFFYNTSGGLG